MSKKERLSAARRKKKADPNQQSKRGAAKPTYVSTDKPKKKKKMKEEFISLPLQLEVPQNDGEFKLGLMFRESLEQDRGMLFVFENTDSHSFHMKNTFIPLDIAFINEEGIIESIKELDPMNPIPVYPDGDIRYAIEVNRGWFAENGIEVGDIILEDTEETEIDLNEVKDKKGKGSGTKDACYHKVKSRYSVWPSAYASGALVKCRKVGAANWGNSRKEEVEYEVNEGVGAALKLGGMVAPKIPGALKAIGAGAATGAGALKLKNIFKSTRVKGSPIPDADDEFIRSPEGESPSREKYPETETIEGASKAGSGQGKPKIGKVTTYKKDPKTGKITKSKPKRDKDAEMYGQGYNPYGDMYDHYDWRAELTEKCWPGYEKKGMKTMFGKRYPNCVKKSKKKK
jgi:uncharacterized membrane protein (UPF0127 family)